MRQFVAVGLLAIAVAGPADATVTLIAKGTLTGSAAGTGVDLSGQTGALENGLPGNILGGLGSGLSYAGGNTFIAVPDRGPNATPYNAAVDDTSSYISRTQTLKLSLTATPGGPLPYSLSTKLTKTTLLYSPTALNYGTGAGLGNRSDGSPLGSGAPGSNSTGVNYFTGRSDGYGSGDSGNPANARFDPESIRVSPDGRHVFISDEYGPYVRQFNRNTGKLVRTYDLPDNLNVAHLSPQGGLEITGLGNTQGRVANKGMEGLALTPDGKTLVGIMQAPLIQDAAIKASKNLLRIVTIDVASGATHEYGYTLTTGSGVSDIVALSATKFVVDERDGKGLGDGSTALVKQAFTIDLTGAVDISGETGALAVSHAVAKTAFLDIAAALVNAGYSRTQIPAKIEGFAFGQDVTIGGVLNHTLYVANDNDFVPGVAGPNQFFVFGFTDADLPGFHAEQFASNVPEPASWALLLAGFGVVGTAARRRRGAVGAA